MLRLYIKRVVIVGVKSRMGRRFINRMLYQVKARLALKERYQ
jgi:hypothetical protein